jgi:hypothetical protein
MLTTTFYQRLEPFEETSCEGLDERAIAVAGLDHSIGETNQTTFPTTCRENAPTGKTLVVELLGFFLIGRIQGSGLISEISCFIITY